MIVTANFLENYRPTWLYGMELDFYFPDHKVGIEFNGDQHYFATDLATDPSAQQFRDRRKKQICAERGIKLITLSAIDLIGSKLNQKLKRCLPITHQRKFGKLNAEAKQYRLTLKEKFGSPTVHRNNSLVRQKAVDKLFEKHPPDVSGKWGMDIFFWKWNGWKADKPKSAETVASFEKEFAPHIRTRHLRFLAKQARKWEEDNINSKP